MASKYQLERELQQYAVLKDNLAETASELRAAGNDARKIGPAINDNYQIDKRPSTVVDRVDDLAEEISKTSNYIRNTVIPAIDDKMDDIREEIRRIEEQERREREAAAQRAANARRASSFTFRW